MMTFPSLTPSTRPLTAGKWRAVDHQAISGGTTTVLLDMTERGRRFSATFEYITQSVWEEILAHWDEHGTFSGFDFDVATIPADWTPAGYWWRWLGQPQASDPYAGLRSVGCEFELVPIVRRSWGGERLTASAELLPGDPLPPPTPAPSKVWGGERLTASAAVLTTSTARQPGQALAIVAAGENATVEGSFILPGGLVQVLGWSTTHSGWLRLYASAAGAAADAGRAQSTAPPSGIGVISDPANQGTGRMNFDYPDVGYNQETPRSNVYPFRFTNYGAAGNVTLIIYYEPSTSVWL